jgi:hypothetical protein
MWRGEIPAACARAIWLKPLRDLHHRNSAGRSGGSCLLSDSTRAPGVDVTVNDTMAQWPGDITRRVVAAWSQTVSACE